MFKKMNKESYMNTLKSCIQALPQEEQGEVIEYYTNYFDDAGDDKKVIEELGDPEKLAEEIKAKFACVPEKVASVKTEDNNKGGERIEDGHNTSYDAYSDISAMKFSFDNASVKNLDMSLGAAEIVMVPGQQYTVETRGIDHSGFRCELSVRGTLIVDNSRRLPSWHFFDHTNPRNTHPRILITIPENAFLDIFRIKVGAGAFRTHNVSVTCNTALLDVSAGQLIFDRLKGGQVDLRCGMGELRMSGSVTGVSNIDCGMGSIDMSLSGNPEQYSIDAKVGLGEVRFNNERKSGLGEMLCQTRKINHFSANCGMGSIVINMVN